MKFGLWLESLERQVYYHVTYWKNLDSIARRGLLKNLRPNFSGRGDLSNHSQSGLFLANKEVRYWVDVLENWAYHNSDNIRKDGVIPVILRVRARPDLMKTDNHLGNPDGAFVYPKNIRAKHVEMWDGRQWITDIARSNVNLLLFIEKESVKGEGSWWTFKDYPYPPEIP